MDENKLLAAHGIKPTANRIIIVKALAEQDCPISMKDLEYNILSLDKSSIFRVLTLFKEKHLVHAIEDGEGGVKYELCLSQNIEEDEDEHVHFYCEKCHRTICMHDVPVPVVEVGEGFELHTSNFLLKGICPECRDK